MFVRKKYSPNTKKTSVQIVENKRIDGKVSQRIVRHVGFALSDDELYKLIELAEYIKLKIETKEQEPIFEDKNIVAMALKARSEKDLKKESNESGSLSVKIENLREISRVKVGVQEIYGLVYRELGFDGILGKRKQGASTKLFHNVMARISEPTSKRQSRTNILKDFGVDYSLESIYQMMDYIDESAILKIQKLAYSATNDLVKEKVKVLFYDCTTLYFESFIEDELREFGFSKDRKFNQGQVVLALLATDYGMPIGYKVYPGSQYEGNTVADMIKQITDEYAVQEVYFVADSGMLNQQNLDLLDSKGIKYIVGARLKSTSDKVKNQILKIARTDGSIADIELNEKKRLIVDYKEKRAYKNREDRKKGIEKLKEKLSKNKNPKSLVSNFGYKNFIKVSENTKIEIDELKIKAAEAWDGLHGIITNDKEMKAADALAQYSSLWQIEECFRISKHDLRIRPIYHWNPRRIHAHIAICFMALVCVRFLTLRTRIQYKSLSAEQIKRELNGVQVSIIQDKATGKQFCIPSAITQDAKKIYQIMGKKISETPFEIK